MARDVVLVAGIVIASFLGGALFALIAIVAAGVREEDRVTMRRQDSRLPVRLSLRGRAPGNMAACVRRLNELSDSIRREAMDYSIQEAKRSGSGSEINALQYYNLVTQVAQKLLAAANKDLQEIMGRGVSRIDTGPLTSMKQLIDEDKSREKV